MNIFKINLFAWNSGQINLEMPKVSDGFWRDNLLQNFLILPVDSSKEKGREPLPLSL